MDEEYYELFFKMSLVFFLEGLSAYLKPKFENECNCPDCDPNYNPNEELEKVKEEIITNFREEIRALPENK